MMNDPTVDKRCDTCKGGWSSMYPSPPVVSECMRTHSKLHIFPVCGTYWEQMERYAHIIDERKARDRYPDAF